jgi:hypothetical protein
MQELSSSVTAEPSGGTSLRGWEADRAGEAIGWIALLAVLFYRFE